MIPNGGSILAGKVVAAALCVRAAEVTRGFGLRLLGSISIPSVAIIARPIFAVVGLSLR